MNNGISLPYANNPGRQPILLEPHFEGPAGPANPFARSTNQSSGHAHSNFQPPRSSPRSKSVPQGNAEHPGILHFPGPETGRKRRHVAEDELSDDPQDRNPSKVAKTISNSFVFLPDSRECPTADTSASEESHAASIENDCYRSISQKSLLEARVCRWLEGKEEYHDRNSIQEIKEQNMQQIYSGANFSEVKKEVPESISTIKSRLGMLASLLAENRIYWNDAKENPNLLFCSLSSSKYSQRAIYTICYSISRTHSDKFKWSNLKMVQP